MQQIFFSFENCVFSYPVQGKLELALLAPHPLLLPRAPLLHQRVAHFFSEQLAVTLHSRLNTVTLRLTVVDFQYRRTESCVQISVQVEQRQEREVQVNWTQFSGKLKYQIWKNTEFEQTESEQDFCQSVVCQQFDKNLPVSVESFIELYRQNNQSSRADLRLFEIQKKLVQPTKKFMWKSTLALGVGCFILALVL